MTKQQLKSFYLEREIINDLETGAKSVLEYCEINSKNINLKCDHIYPDGLIAVGGDYICSICGCGADLKRVQYLQAK